MVKAATTEQWLYKKNKKYVYLLVGSNMSAHKKISFLSQPSRLKAEKKVRGKKMEKKNQQHTLNHQPARAL